MAKRGRPPSPDPCEKIDLRIPRSAYDILCRLAQQREMAVAAMARRILVNRISAIGKAATASPADTL